MKHPAGDISPTLEAALAAKFPEARVAVSGGRGHYSIEVTSPVFAGLSRVDAQRLVYGAIQHLMTGDDAPVHAIDSMKTQAS